MKKTIVFRKSYTRDTCLLLQQLFPPAIKAGLKAAGFGSNYDVININYMEDGVSEVWESVEFMENFTNTLLQKNRKSPKLYDQYVENQYKKCMNELRKFWESGFTNETEVLEEVLEITVPTMFGFFIMFWTGMNPKTPKSLKERALEIRTTDAFWDNNDAFIRKSLGAINPSVKGYEATLLKSEIKKPPSIDTLKKRWSNFVLAGDIIQEICNLTEFEQKYPEYVFKIDVPSYASEKGIVKGKTASGGYAKGKVKILRRAKDIEKMNEGDILIAPMTTPDYIPVMAKAAAVVTDEGGALCHAAIVSREMGKPCVIATEYATKIFNDGETVEVNADEGVVKRL